MLDATKIQHFKCNGKETFAKTPIAMETPSKEWKREVGDMHRGTWRGEVLRKRRGNVKVGEIVSE
jgi:hypothetical protein